MWLYRSISLTAGSIWISFLVKFLILKLLNGLCISNVHSFVRLSVCPSVKKALIANLGVFELSHRYKSLHDVFLQLSTISPCSWFVGFLDYILFYDIKVIPRIIRQNESKCIMLNIKCVDTLNLVMLNFAFCFSENIFGKKKNS